MKHSASTRYQNSSLRSKNADSSISLKNHKQLLKQTSASQAASPVIKISQKENTPLASFADKPACITDRAYQTPQTYSPHH